MSFLADYAQASPLSNAVVTEETPFGPDVLVYKVAGKMFVALVSELIERSYELVIKGMTKAQSELLKDAS